MLADIPDQIATLIGEVKELSNAYAKNKCISHLQDAWAWAQQLDEQNKAVAQKAVCTCPPGGRRADCPLHAGITPAKPA